MLDLSSLNSPDWRQRKQAVEALSQLDSENLAEELLTLIKEQHESLDALNAALQLINEINVPITPGLVALLEKGDPVTRTYAALVLGKVKDPEAATLGVDALLKILREGKECQDEINLCFNAIEALGSLRAVHAVDTLLSYLQGENFFLAFSAITALGEIGDSSAVPHLLNLLDHELLSMPAIQALGALAGEQAIEPICAWLASPLGEVSTAVKSLSQISSRLDEEPWLQVRKALSSAGLSKLLDVHLAQAALPAEEDADTEVYLSDYAQVLGWILKGDLIEFKSGVNDPGVFQQVASKLIELMQNPYAQATAARALAQGGEALVPFLNEKLTPGRGVESISARCGIIEALGLIGSPDAKPVLLQAIQDDDDEMVICSAAALRRIGTEAVYEALLSRLDHPSSTVRQALIESAAAIAPEKVTGRLLGLLNSSNPIVRESALQLMVFRYKYGQESREAVTSTLAALGDPALAVRRAAVEVLSQFEDPQIPSAIAEMLQDNEPAIRAAAARALAKTEPQFALPLLYNALADEDPWVRMYSCRSIGSFALPEGVEHLAPLVHDPMPPVRTAAASSLGQMGGVLALELLARLAADTDAEVQAAARKALEYLRPDQAAPDLLEDGE